MSVDSRSAIEKEGGGTNGGREKDGGCCNDNVMGCGCRVSIFGKRTTLKSAPQSGNIVNIIE